MLMRTQVSGENGSASSIVHRKEEEPIIIDFPDVIFSVAFLVDGKHVASGDYEGRIQRWRIEDGKEVGTPMDAGSPVLNIAVSRDGRWIVSGTRSGLVTVWNAESHSKVRAFQASRWGVSAVDVSPDATKIATGSDDNTACVWALSTGERLLGPFEHNNSVVAAKFSPDGRLIATATYNQNSVRVYDSQNGSLLVELPVKVNSLLNYSLAWASDSKQLFVSSHDGYLHCVDVSTRTTLSKWHQDAGSIALASDDTFIATSADSSVSFWDTASQEQIGVVVKHTHRVWSMVMSPNYDLVACGDKRITLRTLYDIIPSHYTDNVSLSTIKKTSRSLYLPLQARRMQERIANLERTIQELRAQEESSSMSPASATLISLSHVY